MSDWRKFFPMESPPRPGQARAIDFALEEFDKGSDTVVIDAPTGQGKSAIGVTIARYMAANYVPNLDYQIGAYFLTTQKLLQEQYLRDFEHPEFGGMLELKSSTNYRCGYDDRQSCGESKRALLALGKNADGTNWKKHCSSCCVYSDAKREFMQGLLGITNYSFFLAETTYVGKLEPRDLLVLDECHNVESAVSSFVEVEISDRFCRKYLGLKMLAGEDPNKVHAWIKSTYQPALGKMLRQVQESIKIHVAAGRDVNSELRDLVKQNDLFDKHLCKVNRFIDRFDPERWIVNREHKKDNRGERTTFQFKPIDAVGWTEEYLLKHGRKRLMMSATVLDKSSFCRSVGLDESRTSYIALPSTFPAVNRPIHYTPIGKMSKDQIETTLPKLAIAVKALLDAHPNEKGIIHTANYAVARFLRDNVGGRLLVHDDKDREQTLKLHEESPEPTVLCSPSLTEGVDLKDNLARFAIIAKLPYPSLGDKSLRKRCDRDPWYYDYLTVRSFVQALGRSVRHEKDECVTYVIDGCFETFFRKNRRTIPQYILDAVIEA